MNDSKIVSQVAAGLAASLALACSGFHLGWASPSLPKLQADDSDIPITSGESSWIVSLYILACALGPLIGAVLVDRCGRKLSLLLTVVPFLIGCILLGLAQAYWWFLVARFVLGLGTGISYTVAPMYLGEIADDGIRGALGSLITLFSNTGILLAYSVGPWVDRVTLAAVGGALPLLFGLTFVWMPESPHFLVLKGKLDEAKKSLTRLRKSSYVNEELRKVQESVDFACQNAGTLQELVMVPGNRKVFTTFVGVPWDRLYPLVLRFPLNLFQALIIVLGLVLAQQFSGIGAVLAYSGLIFDESGSTLDSSISVILVGGIQVLIGIPTSFIVDLAGRRPLLLLSCCGSILFLGGEALYFQLQAVGVDVSGISWIPVTCIVGYMITYTIGLGSLPYVVLSEMFPCNVKALATTVVSVAGALSGMAIAKLYQVVADAYGIHSCFWGFAGITVFSIIFIYFILPETKQRSLRSIQEELHKTTEYVEYMKSEESTSGNSSSATYSRPNL